MSATGESPSPRLLALDASLARLRALADDLDRGSFSPPAGGDTRAVAADHVVPAGAVVTETPQPGATAAFVRAVGMSMLSTAAAAVMIVGVSAFGDPPRPTFADDGGSIPESVEPGQ